MSYLLFLLLGEGSEGDNVERLRLRGFFLALAGVVAHVG